MELTTLLIPGHNDSDAELDAMTRWVVEHCGPDVPMHFSAFHPDWKMRDVPRDAAGDARPARGRIAMANGVRYAYTGNVLDPAGQTTRCAGCGTEVIVRQNYEIRGWHLDAAGRCESCGLECAGMFEAEPGTWGERRMPVRLGV